MGYGNVDRLSMQLCHGYWYCWICAAERRDFFFFSRWRGRTILLFLRFGWCQIIRFRPLSSTYCVRTVVRTVYVLDFRVWNSTTYSVRTVRSGGDPHGPRWSAGSGPTSSAFFKSLLRVTHKMFMLITYITCLPFIWEHNSVYIFTFEGIFHLLWPKTIVAVFSGRLVS